MRSSLWDVCLRGLVLSIILLRVGLVFLISAMIYPDNLSFIAARFIISCFAYGWIGAKIGSRWIDEAATA